MKFKNFRIIFVIFLIVALITISGCGRRANQNNGQNNDQNNDLPTFTGLSAGMHELSLEMVDNKNVYNPGEKVTRHYILNVPDNFDPSKKYDLLLFFHGTTGNSRSSYYNTGFGELSNKEGFIAVFPQGMGISDNTVDDRFAGDNEVGNKNTCWNTRPDGDVDETCYATRRKPDDDGFINLIIEGLNEDYNIDRIFTSGFSNGCGYAQHVALSRTDIDATGVGGCRLPGNDLIKYNDEVSNNIRNPIPIVRFHGTADTTSPYMYLGDEVPEGTAPTAEIAIDYYAQANGCSEDPVIEKNIPHNNNQVGEVDHWVYKNCEANVEFYKLEDGTHKWYREMTSVIWEFLNKNG